MISRSLIMVLICAAAAWLTGCGTPPVAEKTESEEMPEVADAIEVVIHLMDYTQMEGNAKEVDGASLRTDLGTHWMAYDLEIPQAGRYQVDLYAQALSDDASAWIEDYHDNPDERTYNVTGEISLQGASQGNNEKGVFTKVGTPLNQGIHPIKLHVTGSVDLKKIVFTLIKPHVETPHILTQAMDGDEWTVVWADEFDEGTMPDTSKWTYDLGDWGWGNNELQFYTESNPRNARIEDGHLIIEAHKDDNGAAWTSARLTTRGKTAFTYGRIEFRAKVPAEKGNWAAGWTLGDSYVDELSWPYCGEIDILESVGYQMDNETGNGIAHASAHCRAYYFKLGNQPTGTIEVENMNNEFHTYAVDWSPERIVASVDGVEYFTYDDTSSEWTWPFDKPQNIILNLTMGGGWGGLEGMDETVTSQKMIVDYVRVYEKRK